MTDRAKESRAELRRLAEAATPGPWKATASGDGTAVFGCPRGHNEFRALFEADWGMDADAAYIAATHPQAILALLDENESFADEIVKLRAELDRALDEIRERDEDIEVLGDRLVACRAEFGKLPGDAEGHGGNFEEPSS